MLALVLVLAPALGSALALGSPLVSALGFALALAVPPPPLPADLLEVNEQTTLAAVAAAKAATLVLLVAGGSGAEEEEDDDDDEEEDNGGDFLAWAMVRKRRSRRPSLLSSTGAHPKDKTKTGNMGGKNREKKKVNQV